MNGRAWSPASIARLRELYPDTPAEKIAGLLKRPTYSIYGKAFALGLEKSAAGRAAAGFQKGSKVGAAYRFPKGHVPANKGLRRPGWHAGRMRETQFKKGQFPFNHDPDFYVIGALRVNSDGYIEMRTSFAPGALGWRALHRILWEDEHGPIQPGYCLRFKDRDPLNVCLGNLELISRGDLMRRNSIYNLPAPLKLTIHALGQLKRRIREKQNGRPAQPPVRDARSVAG